MFNIDCWFKKGNIVSALFKANSPQKIILLAQFELVEVIHDGEKAYRFDESDNCASDCFVQATVDKCARG